MVLKHRARQVQQLVIRHGQDSERRAPDNAENGALHVMSATALRTMTAEQKPNFSGDWRLNRQASVLSPTVAPAVQTGAIRIEHEDPSFKCQMTIVMNDAPVETKFELLSDGRERAATDGERRIVSRLGWDGTALVATWRVGPPDGEVTISFRYELQDRGRCLRAAEQIRGGGRDQDSTWVFDRT